MKRIRLLLAAMVTAFVFTAGAWAQEAYAWLSDSQTTLTFFYDNQRASRTTNATPTVKFS